MIYNISVCFFFLFFSFSCTQLGLNDCRSNCDKTYNQCLVKSYIYSIPWFLPADITTYNSNPDRYYSEAESNDTFYDAWTNGTNSYISNSIDPIASPVDIGGYSSASSSANISTNSDIDIFSSSIITNQLNVYTLTITNGSVSCSLYKGNYYYGTNATIPNTFTFLETLNISSQIFTLDATKVTGNVYFICTGNSGSIYSVKSSILNRTIYINPVTILRIKNNLTLKRSCDVYKKNCQKICNANLPENL